MNDVVPSSSGPFWGLVILLVITSVLLGAVSTLLWVRLSPEGTTTVAYVDSVAHDDVDPFGDRVESLSMKRSASVPPSVDAVPLTPVANTEPDPMAQAVAYWGGRLDRGTPMAEVGDTAVLRRHDGLVLRGQLAGVRDQQVLLVEGVELHRIPFVELDHQSRLLVDREYRKRQVEARARQNMR